MEVQQMASTTAKKKQKISRASKSKMKTQTKMKTTAKPKAQSKNVTTNVAKTDGPIYFSGTKDIYGFLSQWHSNPFFHEGIKYKWAEQ